VQTPAPTPFEVQGPELFVNEIATSDAHGPSVAASSNGFVVAWTDDEIDNGGPGVFARRFDPAGIPLGGDFQVNTTATGTQYSPSVASDGAGNFVVVWASQLTDPGDVDVYARRFDSSGAPLGADFRVNTYTTGDQKSPRVSSDAAGNFVVVWTSAPQYGQTGQDGDNGGIFAQRYDTSGNPVGGEIMVNESTTGDQATPAVAQQPYGRFMVVWQGFAEPGRFGVLGRRYDVDGTPSPEFLVGGPTGEDQHPDVGAVNSDFVIAYEHTEINRSTQIFGRIYSDPQQAFVSNAFQANTEPDSEHTSPRVGAMTSPYRTTGFVVVWETSGQEDPGDGSRGLYAQRYDNAPFGTAAFFLVNPHRKGSEYQVNTFTTGDQAHPAVAVDARGQFVVAWDTQNDDDPSSGVIARRFGFPEAYPALVDQAPSGGSSNQNGVLEPGERVVFETLWHNTGQTALELHGALSNLTGPAGPSYTIDDATASYGTLSSNEVRACAFQSDCYEVTVSGARPAQHWDATADETLASDDGPLKPEGTLPPRIKTWPIHVGGSFADVPDTDPFYAYVENIFHNRVTAGGACAPESFCPEDFVLRQQMAVFLLKSVYGAGFVPPEATGAVFDDVPASNPFAPWIEELAREGISAGCSAPPPPALPSYCPADPVNRQQMAVFLLKTRFTSQANPGNCAGIFQDMPCDNPFAPWAEYLYSLQITGGCSASPLLYCPTDPTKRKQMAAFLVKTFLLELYGPD
jgi:hypothetical protein